MYLPFLHLLYWVAHHLYRVNLLSSVVIVLAFFSVYTIHSSTLLHPLSNTHLRYQVSSKSKPVIYSIGINNRCLWKDFVRLKDKWWRHLWYIFKTAVMRGGGVICRPTAKFWTHILGGEKPCRGVHSWLFYNARTFGIRYSTHSRYWDIEQAVSLLS